MRKYKIVCIVQVYNELEKGNLRRFFKYTLPLVDGIVVYDDGSTDGSDKFAQRFASAVIKGKRNEFDKEIFHKDRLLKTALKLKPNFILWLDADEVLSIKDRGSLQEACGRIMDKDLDGLSFHEINIWRSKSWARVDSSFDVGWFVRLWKVTDEIGFSVRKEGLHQKQYPNSLSKIEKYKKISVIHYGFSSFQNLSYKYFTYKSHGQRGYVMLERLIDENILKLKKIKKNLFPPGLYSDDGKPQKLDYAKSIIEIMKYRPKPKKPKFTIICLIYKSTEWLKFSYSQIVKYSNLDSSELYFVANDATPQVIKFLEKNKIPFFENRNTEAQRKEWYINNVYRAWNFGAKKAKGEFIIFVNSDMAYSYDWIENLIKWYDGKNCITSRLIESGKMPSGKFGIEKNFGRKIGEYREEAFNTFAQKVSENKKRAGGLYMPLLIKKTDFMKVKGYPPGNVVLKSDIFNPKIAQEGQPCVSGDVVFMEKLRINGIRHDTSFNSIVYHFQQGEMDENTKLLKLKQILKFLR